jgi:hypothetical protein
MPEGKFDESLMRGAAGCRIRSNQPHNAAQLEVDSRNIADEFIQEKERIGKRC